jgi:ribonuclease HII
VALASYRQAAGTDEAGRGPLAGPVVAAAVILSEDFDLEGVDDSKRLRETVRRELEIRIMAGSDWAVEISWTEEVDRINILRASLAAMSRAVGRLAGRPSIVLVDGHMVPPNVPFPVQTVIGGDATYACIAAASILAKNERDRIMRQFGIEYPGYGFESHFGYATPGHRDALRRLGPCPIHRRSFRPVREALELNLFAAHD